MLTFVLANTLYLLTGLAALVALFTALRWPTMPGLQRLTALFFVALVAHLWEEGRFPGGFTDLIASKLHFTAGNPHFGEAVTAAIVLLFAFVPLLFPRLPFLAMAAMLLGVVEAIAHTAAIWMFRLPHFYSPGLVTAVFLLLPISICGISHAVRHRLMRPASWLLALLYMIGATMLAQQIVVRASGMPYAEFLGNIRANLFGR